MEWAKMPFEKMRFQTVVSALKISVGSLLPIGVEAPCSEGEASRLAVAEHSGRAGVYGLNKS